MTSSRAVRSDVVPRTWHGRGPLGQQGRSLFAELLRFSGAGVDVTGVDHAETVVTVTYTVDDNDAAARAEARFQEALDRALLSPRGSSRIVVDQWDLPVRSYAGGLGQHLSNVGTGLFVGDSSFARAVRKLDETFLAFASALGAGESHVPHLVSAETLDRAKYRSLFPQHLTSCSVVKEDVAALDRVARASTFVSVVDDFTATEVFLSPAACLNVYAAHEGSRLTDALLTTVMGPCARYEARSAKSPTRLWAFRMREIVCVGTEAGCELFRTSVMNAFRGLLADLSLPCRLQTAHDPFFSSNGSSLAAYQAHFDLKYELVANLGPANEGLAVSSINNHEQHFGAAFDIRLADGQPAHSSCVGFGLERWAFWLLNVFGDDVTRWPRLRLGR